MKPEFTRLEGAAVTVVLMIPLIETTFKNMPHSETLTELVATEAAKLERFYGRITRCRVLVEKPHRHHRNGAPYHVRIELDVPGAAIVVGDAPSQDPALVHAEVAIQDGFRLAGRRLQEYARRVAGEVKTHESLPTATVAVLKDDYGFLRTDDGSEIYFHRNSVLNDAFDRLEAGSVVRFTEEEGEKGPQASSVSLVRQGRGL